MLTLFPRIRPNPIAPPPAEPLEPSQELAALLDDSPVVSDSPAALIETPIANESAEAFAPQSFEHETSVVIDAAGRVAIPVDRELVLPLTHPVVRVHDEDHSTEPEPQEALLEPAANQTERTTELIQKAAAEVGVGAPQAEDRGEELVVSASQLEGEFPGFVVKLPDLSVAASNIFDEIEVVHAAADEASSLRAEEPQIVEATPAEPASVSIDEVIGATEAAQGRAATVEEVMPTEREIADAGTMISHTDQSFAEQPAASNADAAVGATGDETARDATIEMGDWPSEPEETAVNGETIEAVAATAEGEPVALETGTSGTIESSEIAGEETTTPADSTEASPEEIAPAAEASGERLSSDAPVEHAVVSEPVAVMPAMPTKPRRSRESFFLLERVPEPEAMDDSGEVEAYASAAAQAHLDAIDDTFVAHAQLLVRGRERGRALDIGTGPGQIVIKLGAKLTRWKFVGVDRSAAMIGKAQESLASAAEVAGRVEFRVADGNALDFLDGAFDLVICNSVLHHVADPQALFAEIARVVKPGGAILLRDLRRPARFEYASHVKRNGKHYAGEMKRLYVASVQAAYTEEELQKLVAASVLCNVHVFAHGKTHIGFERKLAPAQKPTGVSPRTGPTAQRRDAKNSFSNAADSTAFTPAVTST